jgi:outer membrane protein OmpA-like peptidoglycan-associated protein
MQDFFNSDQQADHEEHWMSIADLMSVLMMIFLLIAIAYIRYTQIEQEKVVIEQEKVKQVAVSYQKTQAALYQALRQEFAKDLQQWQASINPETLAVEFHSPDVLFDKGQKTLKPEFKAILVQFFPRYLRVIRPFKSSISEIRIEGHTSSVWNLNSTEAEAYFNNMRLSQDRTRAVLAFLYPLVPSETNWIKANVAAVGLSSSKRVFKNGREDFQRSRRVTFRILTNADQQIQKILELS